MRRLITIAVLGAVLTLLIVLGQQADNWHYQVTGAPSSLLYAATFDGFPDEWETYDDGRLSAQVLDSQMRVFNDQVSKYAFSLAVPHFVDFDLWVDTSALSGPLNNGYGLIFRYRDAQNFYMFLVSSDGYYQVMRVLNNEQTPLSNWIASDVVHTEFEIVNRLRVVARGSEFSFYINGERVQLCIPNDVNGVSTYRAGQCIDGTMRDALVDSSMPAGRVGVVAQTLSEPGVLAQFDNVLVYAPEAES